MDFRQLDFERLAVAAFRSPALHQVGQHLELRFGIRQAGFGVTRIDAQRVIHGAIECRGFQQEFGVGALQVAHGLDDVDALRRVQHLVEDSAGFQAQE